MGHEQEVDAGGWKSYQLMVIDAVKRLEQEVDSLDKTVNNPATLPYYKNLESEIAALKKALLIGNGKPSLVDRIVSLEAKMASMEELHGRENIANRDRLAMVRTIVAAIITSLAVGILKYLFPMLFGG